MSSETDSPALRPGQVTGPPAPLAAASVAAVRGPTLAVLLTTVAAALAVLVPAYVVARSAEEQRQYLKTYRAPFDSEAFFSYAIDYALDSSEPNDVVFVGDSSCLAGIDPNQFADQSGQRAYNLGTLGMLGPDGQLLLVRRYLEHHPPPRAVVLCLLPYELTPPLRLRHAVDVNEGARAGEIVERFLWCYGEPGEFPRPHRADALRYYVRQGLLAGLAYLRGGRNHYLAEPTPNLGNRSYNQLAEQVRADRGLFSFKPESALAAGTRRAWDSGLLLPPEGGTPDDPFPVSAEVDAGVRQLAELTTKHGARLVIRLSPVLESADQERFERIDQWFDQLQAACPNVICQRPAVPLFGPEDFGDEYFHLNRLGTRKFTALLAAHAKGWLADGANRQTSPGDPEPAESKPAESKPAESKPAESGTRP